MLISSASLCCVGKYAMTHSHQDLRDSYLLCLRSSFAYFFLICQYLFICLEDRYQIILQIVNSKYIMRIRRFLAYSALCTCTLKPSEAYFPIKRLCGICTNDSRVWDLRSGNLMCDRLKINKKFAGNLMLSTAHQKIQADRLRLITLSYENYFLVSNHEMVTTCRCGYCNFLFHQCSATI